VLAYAGTGTQRYAHRWLVRCDCGSVVERRADTLVCKRSTQCTACNAQDQAAARALPVPSLLNGKQRPEYKSWRGMLDRCYVPTKRWYERYGGRGIAVCERWRESFAAFYEDVGPRPGDGYTIDRIDNDGDYEPSNVRWATRTQQARNTRRNRLIEIDGVTRCVAEWAELVGVKPQIIFTRMRRGMSPRDAVLTPIARAS
jgi:hypothetical protein